MPYSSAGRPATALSPTFGICWFSKNHASVPSFLVSSRGAWSFHFAGTWRSNMSGGSHDVVVDRHEDHVVHLHGGPPGAVGAVGWSI